MLDLLKRVNSPLIPKRNNIQLANVEKDIGTKWHNLTLKKIADCRDGDYFGVFECACGGETTRMISRVRTGIIKCCEACASARMDTSTSRVTVGGKYKDLVAIRKIHRSGNNEFWEFECSCGRHDVQIAASVAKGYATKCAWCSGDFNPFERKQVRSKNLCDEKHKGSHHANFTVLGFHRRHFDATFYDVECDCGNKMISHISSILRSEIVRCNKCGVKRDARTNINIRNEESLSKL